MRCITKRLIIIATGISMVLIFHEIIQGLYRYIADFMLGIVLGFFWVCPKKDSDKSSTEKIIKILGLQAY